MLEGGVSVDVDLPTEGRTGEGLGTVAGIVLEVLPLALQIYQAISDGGGQAAAYLQPEFNAKIKLLDNQVKQMKTDIDTKVEKLTNIKDKGEYTKLYNPLQKDWQAYQSAKNIVNRIKAYSNMENYDAVANEINNFTRENLIQNWNEKGEIYYTNKTGQPVNIEIPTHKYLKNKIKASTFNIKNFINDLLSPRNMDLEDYTINGIGKLLSKKVMPVSGANLDNAINDFAYAKSSEHARVINSRTQITNQGLNKLMDDIKIPKDSRGVIYGNNSEQSKILWQSPEIQNFIKNNLQDLISGNTKDVYDIEFVKDEFFDDLYYGLQHCKLFNPQITPDGYFKGIIVDYYDFVKRTVNGIGDYLNNWGYSMQEKGLLENQFNIYIIFGKL